MTVPTPQQAAALRAKIEAASAPVDATQAARARAALTALNTAKAGLDSTLAAYRALPSNTARQAAIVTAFPAVLEAVSAVLDAAAATIRASVR